MSYPLIVIHGRAGVGKDTVAEAACRLHDGRRVAFADALKRLAKELFAFTDEQLWGPSEKRNEVWPSNLKTVERAIYAFSVTSGRNEALSFLDHAPDRYATEDTLMRWAKLYLAPQLAGGACTIRHVLQTLGTEWARALYGPDVWCRYVVDTVVPKMLEGQTYTPSGGLLRDVERPPSFVIITDGRFANEVLAVMRAGGHVWHVERTDEEYKAAVGSTHASEQMELPAAWSDVHLRNDAKAGRQALEQTVVAALRRGGFYESATILPGGVDCGSAFVVRG